MMTVSWPSAPLIPDGKNFASGGVQPDSDLIVAENFYDDDCLVQVDIDPALGVYNDVWVRTTDPNNGYRFRLVVQSGDAIPTTKLYWHSMKDGRLTSLGSYDYGFIMIATQTLRIVLSGGWPTYFVGGGLMIDSHALWMVVANGTAQLVVSVASYSIYLIRLTALT